MAAGGEVGGGGEVGAVAGFGGLAGQADGEVGLADAGRPDQQDVGGGLQVAAGGQLVDELPVDGRGGVVVEVLQGGRGGQAGEPQPPGQAAGLGWRSTSMASSRSSAAVMVRPSAPAWSRTAGSASAASCSFSSARWARSRW